MTSLESIRGSMVLRNHSSAAGMKGFLKQKLAKEERAHKRRERDEQTDGVMPQIFLVFINDSVVVVCFRLNECKP